MKITNKGYKNKHKIEKKNKKENTGEANTKKNWKKWKKEIKKSNIIKILPFDLINIKKK